MLRTICVYLACRRRDDLDRQHRPVFHQCRTRAKAGVNTASHEQCMPEALHAPTKFFHRSFTVLLLLPMNLMDGGRASSPAPRSLKSADDFDSSTPTRRPVTPSWSAAYRSAVKSVLGSSSAPGWPQASVQQKSGWLEEMLSAPSRFLRCCCIGP